MNTPEPPPLPNLRAEPANIPTRHGCLTALLIFMLVVNSIILCVYVFLGQKVSASYPATPWLPILLGGGCALNVFLTIALFRWKKWAFYGFCVVATVVFTVNVSIGIPLINAIPGLFGPLVLYGVLQIGGSRKGWTQLK